MPRPGLAAIVATLAAAALCGCGRADPNPQPKPAAQRVEPTVVAARAAVTAAADQPGQPAEAAAPWPPAAMQDPDPRMRRFALEQWAREPTESLDLVTAAMVDPDESIRERAEQVLEQVLAQRR